MEKSFATYLTSGLWMDLLLGLLEDDLSWSEREETSASAAAAAASVAAAYAAAGSNGKVGSSLIVSGVNQTKNHVEAKNR